MGWAAIGAMAAHPMANNPMFKAQFDWKEFLLRLAACPEPDSLPNRPFLDLSTNLAGSLLTIFFTSSCFLSIHVVPDVHVERFRPSRPPMEMKKLEIHMGPPFAIISGWNGHPG